MAKVDGPTCLTRRSSARQWQTSGRTRWIGPTRTKTTTTAQSNSVRGQPGRILMGKLVLFASGRPDKAPYGFRWVRFSPRRTLSTAESGGRCARQHSDASELATPMGKLQQLVHGRHWEKNSSAHDF